MTNSVDPDQTAHIGSGSTLFASILNSSVMLDNYLQQTNSADDLSDAFFLALRVKTCICYEYSLTSDAFTYSERNPKCYSQVHKSGEHL